MNAVKKAANPKASIGGKNDVSHINNKWNKVRLLLDERGIDGESTVAAIKELYQLVDKDMLSWLGRLFDTEIGGFYYSNSARESEEFLPDIESTCQAISILERSGALTSYEMLPNELRKGIGCFITSCADQSGFFYNSQWGKEETDKKLGRRGRDLASAIALASVLGFKLPYPTVLNRIEAGAKPAPMANAECFAEYLATLPRGELLRKSVHTVCSQWRQIKAAGLSEVTAKFLDEIFENGEVDLVGEQRFSNLTLFNSAVTLFQELKLPFKGVYKYADAGADMLFTDQIDEISNCENIWGSIYKSINNLNEYGRSAEKLQAQRLRKKVYSKAPEAISRLTKCLSEFKVEDGSFAYNPEGSTEYSQGMRVSVGGIREGCVNATVVLIYTIDSVLRCLDINEACPLPLGPEDFKHFSSAIEGYKI